MENSFKIFHEGSRRGFGVATLTSFLNTPAWPKFIRECKETYVKLGLKTKK